MCSSDLQSGGVPLQQALGLVLGLHEVLRRVAGLVQHGRHLAVVGKEGSKALPEALRTARPGDPGGAKEVLPGVRQKLEAGDDVVLKYLSPVFMSYFIFIAEITALPYIIFYTRQDLNIRVFSLSCFHCNI